MDTNSLKQNKTRLILYAAVLLVLSILPIFTEIYSLHVIIIMMFFVILATTVNMVVGYTGYLSIGHAAFYGCGAYASAYSAVTLHIPIHICPFIGMAFAALIGLAIGYPLLRLSGLVFAIGTMAFGLIFTAILTGWTNVTGGVYGISNIPDLFGDRRLYFYLLLAFAVICLVISHRLVRSNFGKKMLAIREDETLAKHLGINTTKTKLLVFSLSCGLVGFAGGIYGSYLHWISPAYFTGLISFNALVACILGGIATIPGPALGSMLIIGLPELLRQFVEYRNIIYSVLLIIFLIFIPEGIIGKATEIIRKRRQKSNDKSDN